MAPIKLTYFNLSARAECIRYLLHYGGVEFEDERIAGPEFAARKEKLPLGQLPVLEFEGETLYQSTAICRFLAKRFNLAGKDDRDSLRCDIAVDTIAEIGLALNNFTGEKNEELKKEKRVAAMAKVAFLTEKLENHLAKNDGHFVKGQLTWADFALAAISHTLVYRSGEDIFADRPLLKALRAKIEALPAIKAYIEKCPPVTF